MRQNSTLRVKKQIQFCGDGPTYIEPEHNGESDIKLSPNATAEEKAEFRRRRDTKLSSPGWEVLEDGTVHKRDFYKIINLPKSEEKPFDPSQYVRELESSDNTSPPGSPRSPSSRFRRDTKLSTSGWTKGEDGKWIKRDYFKANVEHRTEYIGYEDQSPPSSPRGSPRTQSSPRIHTSENQDLPTSVDQKGNTNNWTMVDGKWTKVQDKQPNSKESVALNDGLKRGITEDNIQKGDINIGDKTKSDDTKEIDMSKRERGYSWNHAKLEDKQVRDFDIRDSSKPNSETAKDAHWCNIKSEYDNNKHSVDETSTITIEDEQEVVIESIDVKPFIKPLDLAITSRARENSGYKYVEACVVDLGPTQTCVVSTTRKSSSWQLSPRQSFNDSIATTIDSSFAESDIGEQSVSVAARVNSLLWVGTRPLLDQQEFLSKSNIGYVVCLNTMCPDCPYNMSIATEIAEAIEEIKELMSKGIVVLVICHDESSCKQLVATFYHMRGDPIPKIISEIKILFGSELSNEHVGALYGNSFTHKNTSFS